ncbi:MAG TPA: 50S ribosomal protein L25 [Edaphobacter sp.]|nr:50S ribosomal protein L25 [Edaphobacter sp.]
MAAQKNTEAVVATPREGKFNKNAARRVRVAGKIPAVVYGAGQESVAVSVDPKVITRILHSDSGHNTIFDLNVEGSVAVKAMIVDWQNEPIKGKLLHIDLKRIAMDKVMRVSVPIQLVGIPVGVKSQGGILEHVLREVEIECLPADIPSHLDVDVSNMELHSLIHVSDLPHSGSIKFLDDEDATVAHVTIVKEEVAPVEEVAAAPTEPEVAKKGKTDAAAAPAAAAPAADAKDAKKK